MPRRGIAARADAPTDPIGTSTGPDDVQPWPDGCVAWHAPADVVSQRAIAWTAGELDPLTCRHVDAKIWSARTHDNGIAVVQFDGETGVIEQNIEVPDTMTNGLSLFAGAVDSVGNFWASDAGTGALVRVDAETFVVESWAMPVYGYGSTVDQDDGVWTCGPQLARFDPETTDWQTAEIGGGLGCAPGIDGLLWVAEDPIVAFDREAFDVSTTIDLPDDAGAIAMDFEGRLWTAHLFASEAYRVDPATGTYEVVGGLEFPSTEGDMTGVALALTSGNLR